MSHYHQVPSVVDVGVMTDTVRWIQDKLWVDRLETTIEAHTLPAPRYGRTARSPGRRYTPRGCAATSRR